MTNRLQVIREEYERVVVEHQVLGTRHSRSVIEIIQQARKSKGAQGIEDIAHGKIRDGHLAARQKNNSHVLPSVSQLKQTNLKDSQVNWDFQLFAKQKHQNKTKEESHQQLSSLQKQVTIPKINNAFKLNDLLQNKSQNRCSLPSLHNSSQSQQFPTKATQKKLSVQFIKNIIPEAKLQTVKKAFDWGSKSKSLIFSAIVNQNQQKWSESKS